MGRIFMNTQLGQFLQFVRSLPTAKKISIVFILAVAVAGLALMFVLANRKDYQVLFSNLTPEDGGAVVARLKELQVPYRVEANGTVVMVPSRSVHETRLALAGEGLPSSGNVGFEIFDRSDFRTSQFVQELNYRRALQGELARTINRFEEVKQSRVFIVIPKDSLFVEDSKPASASIQLELFRQLQPGKLSAIVHLVANAVEGLDPQQVTVVDTRGRVIFKGESDRQAGVSLSNSQLDYQWKIENEIRENVQSMLEKIVGGGKAIVRVTSEIDFNRVTVSEEEYDPMTTAVRSSRNISESFQSGSEREAAADTVLNQRAGVMPAGDQDNQSRSKKDVATNYEINKSVKTVVKPAGGIKRLSVAVAIDGRYEDRTQNDGTVKKEYVPRSEAEIRSFEEIVKRAMGYNEDREDQVSVQSIAFSNMLDTASPMVEAPPGADVWKTIDEYKYPIVNLLLVVLVFFFIVRPILKSIRRLPAEAGRTGPPLLAAQESAPVQQIDAARQTSKRDHIRSLIENNPEKTQQLIQGWLKE